MVNSYVNVIIQSVQLYQMVHFYSMWVIVNKTLEAIIHFLLLFLKLFYYINLLLLNTLF